MTAAAQEVAPQSQATVPRRSDIDPGAITGQGFGGIRFQQAIVPGSLRFSATKIWSWTDGATQRLILDGDVDATIAGYVFRAKRASIWLEPVTVEGKSITQVFAYFEQLGSAADPAGGVSMTSDRLPVKGMIELAGPVTLQADVLTQGPPQANELAALQAGSQKALVKSLQRETGFVEQEVIAPLPRLTRKSTVVRPDKPPLLSPEDVAQRPYASPPAPEPGERTSPRSTRTAQLPPARSAAPGDRPNPDSVRPAALAPVSPSPAPSAPSPAPANPTQPTDPTRVVTQPAPERNEPSVPAALPIEKPPVPPEVPVGVRTPTERLTAEHAAEIENEPIFAKDGIVTIAPGNVSIVSGEDENTIIATGGVMVQYEDTRTKRVLTMKAQRAVIFADPGKLTDMFRLGSDSVRGVFLEGNVMASDGTHTVHAPQVYYDLRANKAVMLDAVYTTYDEKRRLPLYVRAKSIRQESARQFVAKDARFTNTAFFDPELAIGATTVTITKQEDLVELNPDEVPEGAIPPEPSTETRTIVDARNITLRAMGVPVFYWPRYSGDPATFPIKDFRIENRSGSGGAVRATLNAYALLGLPRPRDLNVDLLTDFYFERGIGLGAKVGWQRSGHVGAVFGYMLPSDRGQDITAPGTRINHDGEFRGIFLGEDRWRINRNWTLFTEVATVSDPNFVQAFFQPMAENSRELTNRLLARRIEDNTYLSLQAKATFEDFISNQYLLESQGYVVNKLPEVFYSRQADDLLAEWSPGLLTWTSEYRVGRIEMAFDEIEARDRGFNRNSLSQRAFGINFDQSIAQSLRAQGLFEHGVTRGDTRHELSLNTNVGPVSVMPFAVGRVTAWDDDFQQFSPDNDENVRVWSSAGVRLSTTLQRVYEGADSRLFDIHRLRHIVEPNATFWVSGTNIEAGDLPVYDYDVEPLTDGTMVRAGITQTFQTQRGGPGQWHNVDLFTLTTDYIYSSRDTTVKSPIPRFFDYRPELSSGGEFLVVDAALRLTDATTLTGGTVFDFDTSQQATTNVGLLVRHAPGFVTLVDMRYINPQDSTYLTFGTSYDLTEKYSAALGLTYDANGGGFQSTVLEVRRRFSSMMLGGSIAFNDITGETSLGIVFQPYGAAGQARLTGLGSSDPLAQTTNSFWR